MSDEKFEIVQQQQSQNTGINFFDPAQFENAKNISRMFAHSELVPSMYQITEKNPEPKAIANCMIAIETANRIGASPLMVMQNMYIVHGQPAWSAKFLTSTVNGCGRFNSIKYKWEDLGDLGTVEYIDYEYKQGRRVPVTKKFNGKGITNWQCIAYTSEKGSEEVLESIPVTVEMAVKEGWYTKSGSKWVTMPKLMLQYRTVTFWTRTYAPELSMGIKTEDEVKDISQTIDVEYEDLSKKEPEVISMDENQPEPEEVKEQPEPKKEKTAEKPEPQKQKTAKQEKPVEKPVEKKETKSESEDLFG